MKNILVTGGAGYIGSHMVKLLRQANFKVLVLDDLSSGTEHAVLRADFVKGSIGDDKLLMALFEERRFEAVIHFAGAINVEDSVRDPGKYFAANFTQALALLRVMQDSGCTRIVFSSSAAVYGTPRYTPIDEQHPKQPINPYGAAKLAFEQKLEELDILSGIRSVCFRYFNAAGADPDGELGECHWPETHVIPRLLQAASGRADKFSIFGSDYETPDGTCIRDFVHVTDLCEAHLRALEYLFDGGRSIQVNLGTGQGYSVAQLVEAARAKTRSNFPVTIEKRRQGDPASLVASASLARTVLGWAPMYSELDVIMDHAWKWEKKYPWFNS